jgi:uncharacterized membrane protein YfcA
MTIDPYAPPRAIDDDFKPAEGAVGKAPPLWNPNAAANWSLVFSPAFGAFLHMANWRALGETEKARSARAWFIGSLLFFFAGIASSTLLSVTDALVRSLGLVYLVVWYYSAAKPQVSYVKARFGKDYPRRGWSKPLLVALAALFGVAMLAGVVAVLFRSDRPI